ncbi:crotonase/enoyl-CoA hydratase family protein [Gordonia neofelifaecis]|uniref:Probable enoyl-CoA hydratase EchA17 n=1 Tax=Gordonia neofelifaecis NRRL B-59395 TaxID=644548 RepID=F1YJ06_9ACTN|nr:crotonase/enoyl-CoA hydratase family protein [Gordonia neofelifaecis]EGD55453.1 putative enoyl-CoA hydratase/isomerase family protein [Gordonia neofelifaecis NRRL B-59395]
MSESTASPVLYEVRDGVAVVTLNRPEAMNAVNAALATGLGEAIERASADRDVRVVVLTGTGRAFCAGADLKAIARGESIFDDAHPDWGFAGLVQHWTDKPVIAAVNGFAMGGGTELTLACDLVVAADTAVFGLPEVKRGLIAGGGGVVRLAQQVPVKRALEMVLTGDGIEASLALEWGLVNRVVPADEVLTTALELARKIAANAPLSVQYSKRALYRTRQAASDWNPEWVAEDPWAVNGELMVAVMTSADAMEGPRAFAEKREPNWRGE